jgi:hypothetical protein
MPDGSTVQFIYRSRHHPSRDYLACSDEIKTGVITTEGWDLVTCPRCLEGKPPESYPKPEPKPPPREPRPVKGLSFRPPSEFDHYREHPQLVAMWDGKQFGIALEKPNCAEHGSYWLLVGLTPGDEIARSWTLYGLCAKATRYIEVWEKDGWAAARGLVPKLMRWE